MMVESFPEFYDLKNFLMILKESPETLMKIFFCNLDKMPKFCFRILRGF